MFQGILRNFPVDSRKKCFLIEIPKNLRNQNESGRIDLKKKFERLF